MAYQFHKPKSSNKPIHIALTILIALVAAAVLMVWLVISYLQNRPAEQPETPEDANVITETVTDPATCLVILDMEDHDQFVLVQTVPTSDKIIIASVPSELATNSGDTLGALLNRNGPSKVTETIADQLDLPISDFILFTPDGVNKFINEMENGISITLPESVTYTDENGITSTLSAGESNLTAGQVAAVLSNTKWKEPQHAPKMATNIMAAVFNNYFNPNYSLKGYFGVLSNVTKTNLRIDNYIAYSPALAHLAEQNAGDIATIVDLDGNNEDGRFVPDIKSCRRNSGLYH